MHVRPRVAFILAAGGSAFASAGCRDTWRSVASGISGSLEPRSAAGKARVSGAPQMGQNWELVNIITEPQVPHTRLGPAAVVYVVEPPLRGAGRLRLERPIEPIREIIIIMRKMNSSTTALLELPYDNATIPKLVALCSIAGLLIMTHTASCICLDQSSSSNYLNIMSVHAIVFIYSY